MIEITVRDTNGRAESIRRANADELDGDMRAMVGVLHESGDWIEFHGADGRSVSLERLS